MLTPSAAAPAPGDSSAAGGGSGCCAVALLVYKATGLVAWLGDARCGLARREKGKDDEAAAGKDGQPPAPKAADKLNAFAVSKDHKAVVLKEKQRIEKVIAHAAAAAACPMPAPRAHTLHFCQTSGRRLRQRRPRLRHHGSVAILRRRSSEIQRCARALHNLGCV